MNTAVNASRSKWWLAAAVLLVSMPASALWKWRDAKGSVQYTDRPPPAEVADKDILQRPAGARRAAVLSELPATASAAPSPALKVKVSIADPALEAKKQEQERAAAAKQKADNDQAAQARSENCARAKTYRQTLNSGLRVARSNDKGETEVLSDAERAQEAQRAQDLIRRDCAP